jgi:predicted lipid carrier protein YhbT
MVQDHIPTPLARFAMRALPAGALQRMIDALLRRMRSTHPRLFKNLERLDAAVVLVEPTDVPHRFALAFGGGKASLTVATSDEVECDAAIKGSLSALLDMLEGRSDGDQLFFSRDIEISGNTAVVVALRNTLDREEIDLMEDITSLFGPFAQPARRAIILADMVAQRVQEHMTVRASSCSCSGHEGECEALREELQELKERLAMYEKPRSAKRKKKAAK